MDADKIALPDSYATPETLNRVLNAQGYELSKRNLAFGLSVQDVRLLDVFVIGPFLIYAGMQPQLSKPVRIGLVIFGVATILYNGHNYLKNRN